MSQVNDIKEMAKAGYRVSEIARSLEIDEKTVRKYKDKEDFSPQAPIRKVRPSKLDPYKSRIDSYLQEDSAVWYKQHHTAKRIHDRLHEDFPECSCSYSIVQRYVKGLKEGRKQQRANQELIWHPGEAQVDFGDVDVRDRGQTRRNKSLTVSFPYSNDGFSQLFRGETAECVCQGLKDIFAYIGGVPDVLVFDNATGVGRRVKETIRETELFMRFRAHYNFSVRFCNPDSGHEKGNVERKVGYNRHNLFVPVPEYNDISEYNSHLLDRHRKKAEENHYRKGIAINKLFEEDRKALLPLPSAEFDVCRFVCLKADGYGKVRLDDRHYYSTRPENAGKPVWVALRAHTVDILDDDWNVLARHERQYGEQRSDNCDYRTSLAVLMRNVGAWKNSGIRELVPEGLKMVMDNQSRSELQATLSTMNQLSVAYNFEIAVNALAEGLKINRVGFCDVAVLAARISGYGLNTTPEAGPDLKGYDVLLRREGQSC